MAVDKHTKKTDAFTSIRNVIIVAFWLLLIVLCCINKDKITAESIVNFTPPNKTAAVMIMLILFAVKSITLVVYGGWLYAASGILFPLPLALFVNVSGTVIMTTIPFFIGKRMGYKKIEQLMEKYPRLSILLDLQNRNEFFVSFFARLVGCLPSDPLGMYLGASGIRYSRYICGTVLGLLPAVISFSVMGMSAGDVTSPIFIISAAAELGLMISSVIIYLIWHAKEKNRTSGGNLDG